MQINERLEKEAQTERRELKGVSFRDKLWYIQEYCKLHTLGVLISLGILWVIGTSIYRSTYESELYCIYVNNRSERGLNTDTLAVDFHDFMEFTDKQLVSTESSPISYGDGTSEYDCASMVKISAPVASSELSVMINDRENFFHYASLNTFSSLGGLLPADLLERVRDRLHYADDRNGVSYACGIMLGGTAFAHEFNLASTPCLLGVISDSKHTDNCITLIRYILSY